MLFNKLKDTQLKSLKYGDDRPGGGVSLEPIIIKPILDANTVGIMPTFSSAAEENKARISALLNSTPRGLKFVSSQRGLQLSNTRLELSTGRILTPFGEGGGFGTEFAKILNRTVNAVNTIQGLYNRTANQFFKTTELLPYNPDNTITQVGALQGEHLDRFGLTPYINDNLKYINIARANNSGINASNNRLAVLRTRFSLGYDSQGGNGIAAFKAKLKTLLGGTTSLFNTATSVANLFGGNPILNQINNKINRINRIAAPYLEPLIDQYVGGPGSTNGLGVTNIRRFYSTNTDEVINGKAISTEKFNGIKGRSGGLLNQSKENYIGTTAAYADISGFSLPVQFPSSLVGNVFDELKKQQSKKHPIYGGAEVSTSGTKAQYRYRNAFVKYKNIEDLGFERKPSTPFNYFKDNGRLTNNPEFDRNDAENMSILFQLINPFTAQNLHRIIFPAYISNFKVSSDATWNDISYIGRSENLYVYTKFKRQVAFGFQIPCFNIIELRERHRALGALESSLAGRYGEDGKGTKLGGILTRLYFGNYFKGETGIINNISYDIPNESSWDIEEKLAHNINVSVNFTVIGNALPTYTRNGGFFNAIENGANFFISSEQALIRTGATTDVFNQNIKNYFSTVERVDLLVEDQGANIPKNANDNASPSDIPEDLSTPNSNTTGIVNQTQFGLQNQQDASDIIETQIAGNNIRNSFLNYNI